MMKTAPLLRKLAGVRFRVTADGKLQAAGLTPELRPLVERHRAQLREHYAPRLRPAHIRWASPPCAANWYAWAPGHPTDGEAPPPGLRQKRFAPSFARGKGRVRTPAFEGVICDCEASRHGRWPVRPDHDCFGESVRYFDPDEIEEVA